MGEQVAKPWGFYEDIRRTPSVVFKRMAIRPGGSISLQRHFTRDEHWVVTSGYGVATVGGATVLVHEGSALVIPKGTVHRVECRGDEPLEIYEVQTGECDESDIERIEDAYGRIPPRVPAVPAGGPLPGSA